MTDKGAQPQTFTLGSIAFALDPNGSFLRAVRMAGEEIFRGIGFAVRDANWGTPSLEATPRISRDDASIRIDSEGRLLQGGATLDWSLRWTIRGETIEGHLQASSREGFHTNRTGFVVLHGLEASRNRPVRIVHPDREEAEDSVFPDLVSPHQPFFDIAGMAYETGAGHGVEIGFEGEVFECEDQRNWTDASYKTYCRPLRLPFPYVVGPDGITQTVRIRLAAAAGDAAAGKTGGRTKSVSASWVGPAFLLPAIGVASAPAMPGPRFAEAVGLLRPDLLAIEVDPTMADAAAQVAAKMPATSGPVRLDMRAAPPEATRTLIEALAPVLAERPDVRLTLWDRDEAAIEAARALLPGVAIGGGTGAFFTELNRSDPPSNVDVLGWTSNPTVHGFDDDTIGETTEPLGDILRTAQARWPGRKFEIGPITLGFRYNPNATSPEGRARSAPPDPRQGRPIAAAWMLGTVVGFLHDQVDSLAFFEPEGPKGFVRSDGEMTPAGHLFRRLAGCDRARVHRVTWSNQPRWLGLLFASADTPALAVANLQAESAAIAFPDGAWNGVEILGRNGFAPVPAAADRRVELPGFGVAWVS
ncbi:hypothetical protein [Labrys monachus]|uniref:Uncharacterized protein n=1 Tax=Labrys monachus TaxID=217067 RepID=A0ABU0FEN2_9HYPH|nr:hypothetical protein [Labrys monachus]MDQ0392505.1 hypothetical protein [Labrys monachus]